MSYGKLSDGKGEGPPADVGSLEDRAADSRVTLVFESSHFAMWAEDVAGDHRIEVKIVPAPAGSDAVCGLALLVDAPRAEELEGICRSEGIEFTRWTGN
jgi:hypothetical protein